MPIVCRTLVYVERPETMKIVSAAFPRPKFELEFVGNLSGVVPPINHIDLFIVDSRLLSDKRVASIKHHLPTIIIEPEYVNTPRTVSLACGEESDPTEESEKIRNAAEKLLRKNYFNWIIDALEYTS